MEQERRTVRFDRDLRIEAYRFEGIMQNFPNHFHAYYVFGFIESGRRHLCCKQAEYTVGPGDLLLFNPLDSHACAQIDGEALDYRCINVSTEVMQSIAPDMTQAQHAPYFVPTVVHGSDATALLRDLHQMVMGEHSGFDKEESFYFLMEHLLFAYTEPPPQKPSVLLPEIQSVCDFIEKHYAGPVTLDGLSQHSGLNKYTLLRNFTKRHGITPYQYLVTTRVNAAKKLLEEGLTPADAAFQAGFVDQSHFSRFFKQLIGLTPKQYFNIFREDSGTST